MSIRMLFASEETLNKQELPVCLLNLTGVNQKNQCVCACSNAS